MGFPKRYDGELRETLFRSQGSQVSMRMAMGSGLPLPSSPPLPLPNLPHPFFPLPLLLLPSLFLPSILSLALTLCLTWATWPGEGKHSTIHSGIKRPSPHHVPTWGGLKDQGRHVQEAPPPTHPPALQDVQESPWQMGSRCSGPPGCLQAYNTWPFL